MPANRRPTNTTSSATRTSMPLRKTLALDATPDTGNITTLQSVKPPQSAAQLAARMMALAPGNDVHGRYWDVEQPEGWKPGDKREGGYKTVRDRPVTPDIWREHIDGKKGLVLALEMANGRCRAAGLDVDEYEDDPAFDHDLLKAIEDARLPLFVHKTKSGGNRVLMFFDDEVDVPTAESIQRGVQKRLGLEDCSCEYFPRVQGNPAKDRKQINMPFFGDKYPVFRSSGMMQPMSLSEFIGRAEREKMNAATRASLAKLGRSAASKPRSKAPGSRGRDTGHAGESNETYAARMMKQFLDELEGAASGERNNLLAKNAYLVGTLCSPETDWIDEAAALEKLRDAVRGWGGNAAKTEDTLVSCFRDGTRVPHNRPQRGDDDMPRIVKWRKVVSDGEDPRWYITVEGSDKEMEIKDVGHIADYKHFRRQCISQLDLHYPPVPKSQAAWELLLMSYRALMTTEKLAVDLTPRGQFNELLEIFLTNKQRATARDGLLVHKPWEDEENGIYEFTMMGLRRFLSTQHRVVLSAQECGAWIRKMGGDKLDTSIKGKSVYLWWVPSTAIQKTPKISTTVLKDIEL